MNIDLITFKNKKFSVDVSYFKLEKPKGVIVVFPGADYSCMGLCIYYPSTALYENGYELLNIEYDFRKNRLESDSQDSYTEYFDFLLSNIKNLNLSGELIAFCKSIGTRIVASKKNKIFDKVIWSTPSLKDDFVLKSIAELEKKSLVIIGTADPLYSKEKLDNLTNSSVNSLVIKGADHGLDIDTDLNRSLDEMKNIISKTLEFVKKE